MRITRPHWLLFLSLAFFRMGDVTASPWVGGNGVAIPIPGGEINLSGASWNSATSTLWLVRQNRRVWEVGFDAGPDTFKVLRTLVLPSATGSDLESCTQVDFSADEIYTLSESQGRLARITNLSDSAIVEHVWNLEVPNNGYAMPPETSAGDGAEGLTFVPDASLYVSGFRYPDGSSFLGSTRGMHGLIFVAHQVGGRVFVFDVNPDSSEDFLNLGSFQTSANESCGLAFDRSIGLLYIWHNPSNSKNSLEVSRLTSNQAVGVLDRYEVQDSHMPVGNLEDIAIVPWDFCGAFGAGPQQRTLFLVHDGPSPNLLAYPGFLCAGYTLDVEEPPLTGSDPSGLVVVPNPSFGRPTVSVQLPRAGWLRVGVYDLVGRRLRTLADEQWASAGPHRFELGRDDDRALAAGLYFVRVETPWGQATGSFVVLE